MISGPPGPASITAPFARVSANMHALYGVAGLAEPQTISAWESILNAPYLAPDWGFTSGSVSHVLTITLDGLVGTPFGIEYSLSVQASSVASADFFSTFSLDFDLGPGLTLNSPTSGFTQTGAVPEPAAAVLLALGVAGLAAAHFRSRG